MPVLVIVHGFLQRAVLDMPVDRRRNKHHFLARHLLAHFAGSDGQLIVHDRRHAWKQRRDIPERLAVENYLYAPESIHGPNGDPKDDAVERWLAEIDGRAARPIAALADGASPDDLAEADSHAVADFIALLDLRTPAVRDLLTPAFRDVAANEIADVKGTQKQLRKRRIHVSRAEVNRAIRTQGPGFASDLAKLEWLRYLKHTRPIARINVKTRRWAIIKASPGFEFITSDLGIAKSLLGPLHPVAWEPGTLLGRAHWIIPVGPSHALAITPRQFPHDPVSTPALVERTNQQLIRDARRYVYARSAINARLFAGAPESEGTSGSAPGALLARLTSLGQASGTRIDDRRQ